MNKYAPRKVFILENGEYIEINNDEYERRRINDPTYANRFFIPVQGFLLEVDQESYDDFYRTKDRLTYLKRLDIKHGLLSIEMFDTETDNGLDYICTTSEDVAEVVAHTMLLDKLRMVIHTLPKDEKELIIAHFYKGKPQTKLAEEYGVNQSNISRRISKILAKIKKLLEI